MKKKLLGLIATLFLAVGMMTMMGGNAKAASFTELNSKIFTTNYTTGGMSLSREMMEQNGIYVPTESVAVTKGTYYKFTNKWGVPVVLKMNHQFFYINICDSNGNTTSKPVSSTLVNTGVTVAAGETFYFYVSGNSSTPSNDKISGNYYIANEKETAYEGSTYKDNDGNTFYTSKCSDGMIWYKRTFEDAEYFQIKAQNGSCDIYINNDAYERETVHDGETSEPVKCEKGDVAYICISGSEGIPINITDLSYEYVELNWISYEESVYKVAKGKEVSIPLQWTKEECDLNSDGVNDPYESKVTYYVNGAEKKSVTGENNDATIFEYTFNSVGKYTLKAVTSEGMKATTTVVVTPGEIPASEIKSTGTYKSSKISWSTVYAGSGTDGYVILVKNSSGKYVKKGTTTGSSYNLKGLSANKTYYVKVLGYVNVDGTKYYDPYSGNAVKVLTAPSAKTKITSLKSKGRKYSPKKWVSGYWTAAGNWVNGYWSPASTSFYYTVKYKKVSGATRYQTNTSEMFKGTSGTGSSVASGNVSSKKFAVKVRAVRKSGTSVAYGPWSASKYVTVR